MGIFADLLEKEASPKGDTTPQAQTTPAVTTVPLKGQAQGSVFGDLSEITPAQPIIDAKIQAGETLSRADLRNLGITGKTSAKQRELAANIWRRQAQERPIIEVQAKEAQQRPGGMPLPTQVGQPQRSPDPDEQGPQQPARPTKDFQQRVEIISKSDVLDNDQKKRLITIEIAKRKRDRAGELIGGVQAEFEQQKLQEELGGKFLKKTHRRLQRGAANVAGGALDLASQVTQLASGGKYGQTAGEYARLYHDAMKAPEFRPLEENLLDTIVGMAAETAPFMAVAGSGAIATGGAAVPSFISSFLVSYAVEGNGAYQAALDRGVPEREARIRGVLVGLTNAGIEVGLGGGAKYFNKGAAAKKALSTFKKGKRFTKKFVVNALSEGLEEGLQETSTILLGGDVPLDADGKPDFNAAAERIFESWVAGVTLGGAFEGARVAGGAVKGWRGRKQTTAEKSINAILDAQEQKAAGREADVGIPPITDIFKQGAEERTSLGFPVKYQTPRTPGAATSPQGQATGAVPPGPAAPTPTAAQTPSKPSKVAPTPQAAKPEIKVQAPIVAKTQARKTDTPAEFTKAPSDLPSEAIKPAARIASIPARGMTDPAVVKMLTEKQMQTTAGRVNVEKSSSQIGNKIDNAGIEDIAPQQTAYDSGNFDNSFAQMVGKTNWEIQQAQVAQEARRKAMKPDSWNAVTFNIQYRNRPELLAELEKNAPAKFKGLINKSRKLTPEEVKAVAQLEKEYAADLERARTHGVIDSSVEHYINQVWNLPKKGSRAGKAKRFGSKMKESLQRKITGGFLEGINLGFEPATLNASELRRIYQENLSRAINEKVFLDGIRDMQLPNGDKLMVPLGKDTDFDKYEIIDHPALKHYRFHSSSTQKGRGVFGTTRKTKPTTFLTKSPMAVHKEVAPKLRAYLEKSKIREIPIVKNVLSFSAMGKHALLSFSGFHHTALGKTAVFYGVNPLPFGAKNYVAGLDLVKNADPIVQRCVEEGGLTLGSSQMIEFSKDIAGQFPDWLSKHAGLPGRAVSRAKKFWDRGLWDKYYVGLKALSAKVWFHKVQKMFPEKSPTEIAKIVANDINNNFGGMNWDLLGTSKTHIDLARLILLAPDWTLSNWRFFTDAARVSEGYRAARKLITDKKMTVAETLAVGSETGSPAMRYMGRVLLTLGGLTALANIALWGEPFPHEDEDKKNKWYMVKLPYKTDQGQYYHLDLIGHFFEPVRAISDPIRWAKGKRSVGCKVVEETITGRDWKGEYIKSVTELYEGIQQGELSLYKSSYDRESTGWEAIPTRVIHAITSVVPIPVQIAIDIGTGNKKPIEALSSFGVPARRGAKPQSKTKKKTQKATKATKSSK